ncbi:glycosyltransferase family 4 protein [Fumia xinanensis]|uniref:Glycosyltransferase family 4 protein n=1 Tax=Fumia xinanensis TaxID=2763659 RepID=A0A926I7L2_9FIRM|nr:glycosyltransferase family 4 protein [Fumia xinanensis]MBC8560069.1 glycosyltransferase family 4 protein [Fumia xinanensis]
MKILVVCQYYKPEPFRISEICEELVKRGNEVTVLTGLPNYPMGEIYEGYRKGKKRDEVINGVSVHRCFTIGRKQGVVHRFLNYYSYAISSTRYAKKIREKFDVVFVNQLSPVMMANAGITYKKRNRVPLILYSLDLWPESLEWGGINRSSPIFKYFHRVSKKIYEQADCVAVTSKLFARYFADEFNINQVEYLPQFAEDIFSSDIVENERTGEDINLVFAGNIGVAQSIVTMIKAADLVKDIGRLKWHIVGDGSELNRLKNLSSSMHMDNVVFHGRKPLEKMPEIYAKADAMLVTMQKSSILSYTLPGKVQTYMAAGKPIIGAIDGETALIIKEAQCGFCSDAEDAEALAENVRRFIASDAKEQMGRNARSYYDRHFSKEKFMEDLDSIFYEIIQQ